MGLGAKAIISMHRIRTTTTHLINEKLKKIFFFYPFHSIPFHFIPFYLFYFILFYLLLHKQIVRLYFYCIKVKNGFRLWHQIVRKIKQNCRFCSQQFILKTNMSRESISLINCQNDKTFCFRLKNDKSAELMKTGKIFVMRKFSIRFIFNVFANKTILLMSSYWKVNFAQITARAQPSLGLLVNSFTTNPFAICL